MVFINTYIYINIYIYIYIYANKSHQGLQNERRPGVLLVATLDVY